MNCLEWVILIMVLGIVSMLEICVITICVGKVLDEKMKTRTTLEYKIFKAEMKEVMNLLDFYFDKFISLTEGKKPDRTTYASYTKINKPDPDPEDEEWLNV